MSFAKIKECYVISIIDWDNEIPKTKYAKEKINDFGSAIFSWSEDYYDAVMFKTEAQALHIVQKNENFKYTQNFKIEKIYKKV